MIQRRLPHAAAASWRLAETDEGGVKHQQLRFYNGKKSTGWAKRALGGRDLQRKVQEIKSSINRANHQKYIKYYPDSIYAAAWQILAAR